jgi:serine/threonine protein kinase
MSDQEHFEQVERLFHDALQSPAAERDRFLITRCGSDASLLDDVRRLLAADEVLAGPPSGDGALPRFGAFQAERILGRGGRGVVYLARRVDGQFQQFVAVKVIAREAASEVDTQLFLRERGILASLRHPSIAQVLDGGVSSEGPYLVMEFIDGRPLDRHCHDRRMDVGDRLRLFIRVCEAVSYAHRNLIVHRDLKPSNVLVTSEGHPKLVDFGTAKMLAVIDGGRTERLATPQYASPEQLRGEPVGTATDIYSLGVVLFELLTGGWPFGDPASRVEWARRLVEDVEPAPPAQVVSESHAASCGRHVAQLRRILAGDIAQIVRRSLEPSPDRRYRSVDEFAEDLGRYLRSEPVQAHAPSWAYRARRFAKRRFWYLAAAGLSAASLVAATGVSYSYARRAQMESARAQRIARFATNTLLSPTPAWFSPMTGQPRPITVEDLLDSAADRVGTDLRDDPAAEAELRATLGTTWAALGNLGKASTQLDAALALMPSAAGGLENERSTLLWKACEVANQRGDYSRARSLCAESLDTLERARHPDPDNEIVAPFELAYMSAKEGDPPAEVERLYQQSVAAAERNFGAADLRILMGQTRLGIARYDAGDLEAAQRTLEAVTTGMAARPGPPVELAIAERALAAVYRVQGAWPSAEAQANAALALLDRRPAPFIDRYLIELERFLDLALQGRAKAVADATLAIESGVVKRLPAGHVDRARPEIFAGRVLVLANRCAEAEPLLREASDIYHARMPRWPAMQADALAGLAESLDCQGRHADAQHAAAEAIQLYRNAFGANASEHPAVTTLARFAVW